MTLSLQVLTHKQCDAKGWTPVGYLRARHVQLWFADLRRSRCPSCTRVRRASVGTPNQSGRKRSDGCVGET
eukprot:7485948-Heterocapsa_arctica.AAC.1